MPHLVKEEVKITPFLATTRAELGQQAAFDIAAEVRARLNTQPGLRMIFAAAPSQSEMLASLIQQPDIDWARITAFHMDEYLGLSAQAPQRFGNFLCKHIFDRVPFGAVHLIEPGPDAQETADDYAALLAEAPIDIVCCGIGANGHLAFNDPPADFDDATDVKIVQLDATCRQQQVDDLCFDRFEDVPTEAITLSIPRLLAAHRLFCCVPGALKADAVRATLEDALSENCPASILRLHANCKLYLDADSAAKLTR